MAGALDIKLTADTAQMQSEMSRAAQVAQNEMARISRASAAASASIRDSAKAQREAGAASSELTKATHGMEGFSFATAGAKRELLVLAHELSQGNYSRFGGSMLVLGERTGAAALLFSGLGVGVLGATAALGGFATAVVKGLIAEDEFNKSLQLTGNFAGLTASSFDKLAASASKAAGASVGSGKDALQSLVSSGRFGPEAIAGATQATLNMERLTGQSADEIAKDFAKMGDGVAKWAAKHNEQFHYLSATQFAYIKQLEDQGKLEQSEVENLRALNDKIGPLAANVTSLGQSWKDLKNWASEAWDAMSGTLKAGTTQQQIAKLQSTLAFTQSQQDTHMGDKSVQNMRGIAIENLRQQIYLLQEKATLEQRSATLQAVQGAKSEAAIKKMMTPAKGKSAETKWDAWEGVDPALVVEAYARASAKAAEYAQITKDVESAVLGRYAAEHKAFEEQEKVQRAYDEEVKKYSDAEAARNKPMGAATAEAMGKYMHDVVDQTKAAEQLVSGSFSRMEDAIVQFTHTGKLSFKDLWGFMADEFLRQRIRVSIADIGKSTWFQGALGTLGAVASGSYDANYSHEGAHLANGLSYVPSNGYPAILHEGERVMTRQDNVRASSGGGPTITFVSGDTNVGQGVSRGEVQAAMKQTQAETEMRIKRLMRNGNIG